MDYSSLPQKVYKKKTRILTFHPTPARLPHLQIRSHFESRSGWLGGERGELAVWLAVFTGARSLRSCGRHFALLELRQNINRQLFRQVLLRCIIIEKKRGVKEEEEWRRRGVCMDQERIGGLMITFPSYSPQFT